MLTHMYVVSFFFFFFKQKTAYEMRISDWSSDVCSSDLERIPGEDVDLHMADLKIAAAGDGRNAAFPLHLREQGRRREAERDGAQNLERSRQQDRKSVV